MKKITSPFVPSFYMPGRRNITLTDGSTGRADESKPRKDPVVSETGTDVVIT